MSTVTSFMKQSQGTFSIKTFYGIIFYVFNKLECLLLSVTSINVRYFEAKLGPTIRVDSRKGLHSGELQPWLQILALSGSDW